MTFRQECNWKVEDSDFLTMQFSSRSRRIRFLLIKIQVSFTKN